LIKYILLTAIGLNAIWILYQDLKFREVYLVSILSFIVLAGWQNWNTHLFWNTFILESLLNLLLMTVLITVSYIYLVGLKKKKSKELIGLGDIFLFVAFVVGYGIVEFYIQLTLALFAALLIHLLIKGKYPKHQTVPLAGYMSVYFFLENLLDLINLPVHD